MEVTEQAPQQVLGLVDLLRTLRRRWRWVIGSTVVLTGLTLGLSLQQAPVYVAESSLLLPTVADAGLLQADPNAAVPFFADRQVKNALQVLESGELRDEVEKDYDGPLDVTSVHSVGAVDGSDAVTLSARSTDAKEGANLVNTYAQTYIDYSRKQRLDALATASAQIQLRIDDLRAQRDDVARPLTEVDQQLASDPTNESLQAQRASVLTQIQPQLYNLDQQIAAFVQSLQGLALTTGLAPESNVQFLTKATADTDPVSPNPLRDAIVGLMLGLGLGVALALVREFLDESIRTPSDLELVLRGRYPLLGVIPLAGDDSLAVGSQLPFQSPVAEAYRSLRTSVRFAQLDRPLRVFQITSPAQGDGKTTTAANLARALAQAGHRVGVACCDLRRPRIHRSFGVPPSPGLADVVLGEATLAEALREIDGMYVLAAGTPPPNPSELLGTARVQRVMEALGEKLDFIIVDSTPVLAVTDAIVISRFVDATIVVVSAGDSTRRQVQEAINALEASSTPIIGFVLNRAGDEDRNFYGYSYGESSGDARRRGKTRPSATDRGLASTAS